MTPEIYSPFSANHKASILSVHKTTEIIEGYKKYLNLAVAKNFKNISEIFLCECPVTRVKFYFPPECSGDGKFYESISQNDWYYNPQRWEHTTALDLFKEGDHVLEVGSGDGTFLKILSSKIKVHYTGLELNLDAIFKARNKGINLSNETLEEHIKTSAEKYDVVCSFQVLEHVSRPASMIEDSLKALKKEGRFIIAVPNNEAYFLKHNIHSSRLLNMPPHHINLFDETSLHNLAKIFNLKIVQTIKEPLQDSHIDILLYNIFYRIFLKSSFCVKAVWRLKLYKPFRFLIKKLRNKIVGHTIIVVYEKL